MPLVFVGQRAVISGSYLCDKHDDIFERAIFISKHYCTLFNIYTVCVKRGQTPPILIYWDESKEKVKANTTEYYSKIVDVANIENIEIDGETQNTLNKLEKTIKDGFHDTFFLKSSSDRDSFFWILHCNGKTFAKVLLSVFTTVINFKSFPFLDNRIHFIFDIFEALPGIVLPFLKISNDINQQITFFSNSANFNNCLSNEEGERNHPNFLTQIYTKFTFYAYLILRPWALVSMHEYANAVILISVLTESQSVKGIFYMIGEEYVNSVKIEQLHLNGVNHNFGYKSDKNSFSSTETNFQNRDIIITIDNMIKNNCEVIENAGLAVIKSRFKESTLNSPLNFNINDISTVLPKYIATVFSVIADNYYSDDTKNSNFSNVNTTVNHTNGGVNNIKQISNNDLKQKQQYIYSRPREKIMNSNNALPMDMARRLISKVLAVTNNKEVGNIVDKYVCIPYSDLLERYIPDIRNMFERVKNDSSGDTQIQILNCYYDEESRKYKPDKRSLCRDFIYDNIIIHIASSIQSQIVLFLVNIVESQLTDYEKFSSITKHFDSNSLRACCRFLKNTY